MAYLNVSRDLFDMVLGSFVKVGVSGGGFHQGGWVRGVRGESWKERVEIGRSSHLVFA